MSISHEQVRHVARLARIALTDEEVAGLAEQLSGILAYAEQVGQVAAADVEPTSHPYPLRNADRADDPAPSLPADAVLANAPAAEDQRFRVPRIVGEEA